MISGIAECVGNGIIPPFDGGLSSSGSPLVGVEVPGDIEPCSTLRIAIRPYEPSKPGVSTKGEFGIDVGAVENPPPDPCEEYESP
jgi:hypothetical protein